MILECARKQRRYTIANSAYNRISMFSGPAHALIRYLEGDTLASQVKPTPGFKDRITAQLCKSLCLCSQQKDAHSIEELQRWLIQFQEHVTDPDYSSFGGQAAFTSSLDRALTNQ